MYRFILKIFMLENRQLLRWGSLNGYLNVGMGLTFIVASMTLFQWMIPRLDKATRDNAAICRTERDIISDMKDPEELRAFALTVSHNHEKLHATEAESPRGLLKVTCACVGLAGLLYVGIGFTIFRARELALEVEENRPE